MSLRTTSTSCRRFIYGYPKTNMIFKRTCFTPVYGFYNERPYEIPKQKSPMNPNLRNQELAGTTPTPDIPREFPDHLSPYEIRLQELCKLNRLDEVAFILQKAGDGSKFFPTLSIAAGRFIGSYFAKQGRTEDLKKVIMMTLSGLDALADILIHSLVEQGDYEQAKDLFQQLDKDHHLNVPSLKQKYLQALCVSASTDEILNLVKEIDIIPSMQVHDMNINRLLESDNIDDAYKYKDFMINSLDTLPDNRIINKFIVYHVEKGELEKAEELMMSMNGPIYPNLDSFHDLICAHCINGNMEKFDYLLWRIGRRQLSIDRLLYADILYSLAYIGEHKRVEKTLHRMRKEGKEPELDAFNGILRGYAEAGNFKYVNLTFDELRFKQFDVDQEVPKTIGQFLRPDSQTFHYILQGYDKNRLYQHGFEIFRFMRGRGIEPLKETIPFIKRILKRTKSELPLDVKDFYDYNEKSKILSRVMDDTVSHEHKQDRHYHYNHFPEFVKRRDRERQIIQQREEREREQVRKQILKKE